MNLNNRTRRWLTNVESVIKLKALAPSLRQVVRERTEVSFHLPQTGSMAMVRKMELEKIGQQLLPGLPGFNVVGGTLFMSPIGHTLRGIGYGGSGGKEISAHVFIQPLFVPSEFCSVNIGWELGVGNGRPWNIRSPNFLEGFGAVLQREALPFLLPIKSPLDVARAALSLKKSGDPVVRQAIFFAYCRAGDVEAARNALDQFINPLLDPPNEYWDKEIEQARALMNQLETSPADAQRQLDAWEAESARNLKLEKYR
jgi:hypothetical protein